MSYRRLSPVEHVEKTTARTAFCSSYREGHDLKEPVIVSATLLSESMYNYGIGTLMSELWGRGTKRMPRRVDILLSPDGRMWAPLVSQENWRAALMRIWLGGACGDAVAFFYSPYGETPCRPPVLARIHIAARTITLLAA